MTLDNMKENYLASVIEMEGNICNKTIFALIDPP